MFEVFGLKGLHMTAQAFSLGLETKIEFSPERDTHVRRRWLNDMCVPFRHRKKRSSHPRLKAWAIPVKALQAEELREAATRFSIRNKVATSKPKTVR